MITDTVVIGCDHAGTTLKAELIEHIRDLDLSFIDVGTNDDASVDYPDYAHALCRIVDGYSIGILICGTGIGMSIVANRYSHIRCAVAVDTKMAIAARQHNDANVLALGARLIDTATAIAIVDSFLNTSYEGGRHAKRLTKINGLKI